MKKQIFLFSFALGAMMMSGCTPSDGGNEKPFDYELRTLTFEDADYKGSAENAATYWSDFIPTDGEYGKGNATYSWYDEANTELAYNRVEGEYGYYDGHAGISHFVGSDYATCGNYLYDLQAYNVKGGHSGTNFNVHSGSTSEEHTNICIEFTDGVARIIDHMWVTNTTYVYSVLLQGDMAFGSSYSLSDTSTFKIVAYGYKSYDDENPATCEFYLLNKGKKFVTDWTRWDLSSLGKVVKVAFNLVGSEDMYGDYGLCVPGYFAYDDVAVRFEK